MAKKSKNPLILIGVVVVVLVLAGIVVYALQKDEQNNQPSTSQQKNCTTYNDGTVSEQCAEDYIGLKLEEAADKAKKNDLQPVVAMVDGENRGFTDIFRSAPIYFEVENNSVTRAYFEHDRSQ